MKKNIRIVEVGPRDGLQNEKTAVPINEKLLFVESLFASGLKEVELTSFVKADKIPQLSDAVELTQEIKKRGLLNKCWFLVPNVHGAEIALKLGISNIAFFSSPSESFNFKNINCTTAQSLKKIEEAKNVFKGSKVKFRGYISMVFGCPYEGKIPPAKVFDLCKKFFELGLHEISLGDTIGVANPQQVKLIIQGMKKITELKKVAMHFHDTKGMALVNIFESINLGITAFDSSAAGLGGCPYARGATGNVATEDLVYLVESMGFKSNIDLNKLFLASQSILKLIKKESQSKMNRFLANEFLKNEKK